MGIRIIKTALAVLAAIYLSTALQLHSPNSAGLLAILGVDVTKKKSLRTSFQRIAASLVGLLFAAGLFWALGFHVWVIGLFILCLYPVLSRLNLKEGVVTSSVVMFHVYAAGQLSADMMLNEVALLLLGLGTATLINLLYMPSEDKQLTELRGQVEELFSRIFKEIGMSLRDTAYVWSGIELIEAEDVLAAAQKAAHRFSENSLRSGGTMWSVYFYMRKQQLESIEHMMQLVSQVYETLPHGASLASVFEELSRDVKVPYYTGRSEKRLSELEQEFKCMPLPASREEFEVRSALLQLMVELQSYLAVAKKEKRPLPERSS
ncbi:aromatic acid exporter family protein [Paenibacillus filicis]|uniref:Aromatic acid exporter family protein n=1 Tax=Paenibacillus gyeongsangnamensis TaxID=3388067 RepID=A0ABT4Q8R5_9BACL|nr:aromatic acid exporter family protein [Paenibacillus filicis]MCZ8513085.1 aromatic acid exporter family protein [Paenibacillus filicis]